MVKSKLKQEWDKKGGKLERVCKVCKKEFTPKHWRQSLCEDEFCKQGSFRKSHYEASLKRWKEWLKEAKRKKIAFS